jgi:hypothetical protein
MKYKTFDDMVDGTPTKRVYKFSRKEIYQALGRLNDIYLGNDNKKFNKIMVDLLALADKPNKEWICPNCLGRNGCMCALKPTPLKTEPKEECNCNYPDLVGMNCPIHGLHSTLNPKPEIEKIKKDSNWNRDNLKIHIMRIELKINEIIDYLSTKDKKGNQK